jgi:GT2 family glycosyltransferase
MTVTTSFDSPQVTLVTVTFNAAEVFEDFWQSLTMQEGVRWSLVVVDNASTDDTSARLSAIEDDPRVTVVRSPTNTGAAGGNNIGLHHASASPHDYIVLCNNDIVFPPTTLAQLVRAKETLPPGAISPVLVFDDDRAVAWFESGVITAHAGVRCVHRSAGSARPTTVYPTSYAPTTFLLMDRVVGETTGQLDELYFAYWEDADYIWRARQHGFGLWVDPNTIVVHKVSQSSGGFQSQFSNYQYYKNQVRFAFKHFGAIIGAYTIAMSASRIAVRCLLRLDTPSLSRSKAEGLMAGLRGTLAE